MQRRKNNRITIGNANNLDDKLKEIDFDEIVNISLDISLELPTEKEPRLLDISTCLGGLKGEDFKNRHAELRLFRDFILKSKNANTTKCVRYVRFREYVKIINEKHPDKLLSSVDAIKYYQSIVQQRVKNGLAKSTYKHIKNTLKKILESCYNLEPKTYDQAFPTNSKRTRTLQGQRVNDLKNNTKAYSKKDSLLMLKVYLAGAQHYKQHYNSGSNLEDMINKAPFIYHNNGNEFRPTHDVKHIAEENYKHYLINTSTVNYIWAFLSITGLNITPVLLARRDSVKIVKGERDLVTLRFMCQRKGKEILIESFFRKYQLRFYNEIIEHSKYLDPSDDALLFSKIFSDDSKAPFSNEKDVIKRATRYFKRAKLVGEFSEILYPTARKIRNTHGLQFDDTDSKSEALGNTPETASQYYSDGHSSSNNNTLQKSMNIFSTALLSGDDVTTVKGNFESDIDVRVIYDEGEIKKLRDRNTAKVQNGGYCLNSKESNEAVMYTRKIKSLKLLDENDELSCANVLACFTCSNHIFLNDLDGIYLLLSFQKYLVDCHYGHEAGGLFGQRPLIEKTILAIDELIENKLEANLVNESILRIKSQGVHPLWDLDI
jgi:hypothetical protein